jgi:hypothetical protein
VRSAFAVVFRFLGAVEFYFPHAHISDGASTRYTRVYRFFPEMSV